MREENMRIVSDVLAQALYVGLEAEVVLDALALIKEDPTMDSTRALVLAAADWDVLLQVLWKRISYMMMLTLLMW